MGQILIIEMLQVDKTLHGERKGGGDFQSTAFLVLMSVTVH